MSDYYKELEELAIGVGAGVVLIGHKDATSFLSNKKSLMLPQLKTLHEKKEYIVKDIDDHQNKDGNKTLAAALLVCYMNDLDSYGQMMHDDYKNIRNLSMILFGVCVFLVFTLLA